MDDRRRVVHVVSSLDDGQGGQQAAVIGIANAQVDSGHEVWLLSTTGPDDTHAGLANLDPRVSVRLFERGRTTRRFSGSPPLRRWVRKALNSFDVVHVHSMWAIPAYQTALRAALRGRQLIISPHGSLDPFDLRKHARAKRLLGRIFIRPILARAHAVHCTAEREAYDLETYGAHVRRVVVTLPLARPATPPVTGAGLRESYRLPPDCQVVLFLGRIDYKKGLPPLLEALSLLPEPRRPYLLIAGRGTADYEKQVSDLVSELGLERQVVFGGWLAGPEKAAALAEADLFVLLSDNENYGISVMEAVQAGCPVVVTEDVYIGAELVAAGAAVFSTQAPKDAAAVIGGLLGDPERRAQMRVAARRYIDSTHGSADVARQYSDLLAAQP